MWTTANLSSAGPGLIQGPLSYITNTMIKKKEKRKLGTSTIQEKEETTGSKHDRIKCSGRKKPLFLKHVKCEAEALLSQEY